MVDAGNSRPDEPADPRTTEIAKHRPLRGPGSVSGALALAQIYREAQRQSVAHAKYFRDEGIIDIARLFIARADTLATWARQIEDSYSKVT